MADDDPEVPARPQSRGPRVVTGAMLRKEREAKAAGGGPSTGDDTQAQTLVGPDPTPPPASDEPRRPRVVTGRTAPSPAASAADAPPAPAASPRVAPTQAASPRVGPTRSVAARAAAAADATPAAGTTRSTPPPPPPPPPAFDDDAFDEEWPSPPTRTIPAPVHRSAAPPPAPPPTKAGRPKAARTPSGEAGQPLARTAFGLALGSIVLFGVPAIPALVVAGRARRQRAGKGASPLITAARIVAVFSLVAWLTVAGILIANAARPEGVDYAELKAGDCIDTPETSEVRRLRIRSCEKPHDAEVFAVITHPAAPGDAFPGAEALLQFAANACLGQPFTDYVGTPRGQSQLTEFEIVPESEAWSDGRRGLVCAVDNPDRSPLTASVKGTAR